MPRSYNLVKVFSVTKPWDRHALDQRVNAFLRSFKGEIVDYIVRQSSDSAFHCFTIVLLLKEDATPIVELKRTRTRGKRA